MSHRMLVAALAVVTSGCVSMQSMPTASIDPIALPGALVQRTSFEGPGAAPAAGPDAQVRGGGKSSDASGGGDDKPMRVRGEPGTEQQQRTRKALFWAGIAFTVIGGATLLATGIGGRVTQGQLTKGYDDETLTHDEEKTLRNRGETFNALAGAGGGVMIVGAGVAAITFGIDYTRCGSIAKRKRKDCK